MKLKYNNTEIKFKIIETGSSLGIHDDDRWCIVDFYAHNDEFIYHIARQSITKHEIISVVDKINALFEGKIDKSTQYFIKNYFIIHLYTDGQDKKMDLELRDTDHPLFKNYKLSFENKEIVTFQKMSEKIEPIDKW